MKVTLNIEEDVLDILLSTLECQMSTNLDRKLQRGEAFANAVEAGATRGEYHDMIGSALPLASPYRQLVRHWRGERSTVGVFDWAVEAKVLKRLGHHNLAREHMKELRRLSAA